MKGNIIAVFAIACILCAMLSGGCSKDKGKADMAIKAAETAITAARAEAEKYVPDEVKSLESDLAAAKENFSKKEYAEALSKAQSLADRAKNLDTIIAAKKEELTKTWTDLEQGLQKMMGAVQSRVDILSKSKKLPANLTAEKFAEVTAGLATAKEQFGKASESFKAGNLADAVSVANSVKGDIANVMVLLGMPVPEGAK